MEGTIALINSKRAMAAVETVNGYTIIEFSSPDDFKIGEEIRWSPDTQLGGGIIFKTATDAIVEVFFQNHHVHQNHLNSQLRIK